MDTGLTGGPGSPAAVRLIEPALSRSAEASSCPLGEIKCSSASFRDTAVCVSGVTASVCLVGPASGVRTRLSESNGRKQGNGRKGDLTEARCGESPRVSALACYGVTSLLKSVEEELKQRGHVAHLGDDDDDDEDDDGADDDETHTQ
ncbi:hypothetical protein EYF80_062803 [Liparis tanakae]|uniref:Uncharacterized protein n=1 Tax=Liparis tanakae TaxID=230148 RepID=A0A4Z2EEY3_9TELE|nr:hypothetical protein EYF80_062803 [Liparis tanakae]